MAIFQVYALTLSTQVIVGGGTAGLCVAARLTENPDVKVGVIEAGANRMEV
jgi:choline dehydrogenase-like flavoprotein